mmetsp:Transcript_4776/g.10748  ORF Transcript_4776/g.10748 Transcript_4776/m.10748 type:complete len:220 (-) Transcript_4776:536-1195(-)
MLHHARPGIGYVLRRRACGPCWYRQDRDGEGPGTVPGHLRGGYELHGPAVVPGLRQDLQGPVHGRPVGLLRRVQQADSGGAECVLRAVQGGVRLSPRVRRQERSHPQGHYRGGHGVSRPHLRCIYHHESGLPGPLRASRGAEGFIPAYHRNGAGSGADLREHDDGRGLPECQAAGQQVLRAVLSAVRVALEAESLRLGPKSSQVCIGGGGAVEARRAGS